MTLFNKLHAAISQRHTGLVLLLSAFLVPQWSDWNVSSAQGKPGLSTRSPVALQDWARAEIRFCEKVKGGKIKFQIGTNVTQRLNWYLADFENSHADLVGFYGGDLDAKAEAIASNPIASYLMGRRFITLLMPIRNSLKNPDPNVIFPRPLFTKNEVKDCLENILAILFFYDIRVTDFCSGKILGIQTGARLNSRHCWEIAKFSNKAKQFIYEIQFLEEAMQRQKKDKLVNSDKLKEAFYLALKNNDDLVVKYETHVIPPDEGKRYVFPFLLIPVFVKYGPFMPYLRYTVKDLTVREHSGKRLTSKYAEVNNWEICKRGNIEKFPNPRKKFCWLETRKHAYWNINPLRMEFISRDPDIIQAYDVLGPKKMSNIQKIGSVSLKPSGTNCGGKGGHVRNSVGTFIKAGKYPDYITVQKLAEKITGLKIRNNPFFELTVVSAYTFGGQNAPHPDTKNSDLTNNVGTRLATFMLFLEEPKRGGFTSFPLTLVSAKPVKGSALFWYNTFSDGTVDKELVHSGCPVVLGSKWKWISYYNQLRSHPCGLKPKERFRFISNAK